jgi:putative hydrolase of the HAD superfamily
LKHGTTLRGLMLEHGLVPTRFLDFVHDIDYGAVQENQSLRLALSKLPGRKLIFTNGTTAHAERVLHRLGVSGQFDGCYDIVDSDYIPKPDRAPYAKFLRDHGVTPETSAFFEDIPQNLIVPRAMGMTTVLISETDPTDVPAHIDHVTGDLARFLNSV